MRKPRNVTIQDVANIAGVSTTSVSNYLNGRMQEMRKETQQRIADAISHLGYTPNTAARQLKTGKMPILGLLVPSVMNPFYGELAAAVDAAAQRKGFRVLLCNTQREPERELSYIQELLAYGVRGIITASIPHDINVMNDLIKRGAAFVLFETLAENFKVDQVDFVLTNNSVAAEISVDYLVGLGHSTIAYATAPLSTPHRISRLQGFKDAMQRFKEKTALIIIPNDIVGKSALHKDAELAQLGHEAAQSLVDNPARPTAVIAMNDLIALGMMSGFQNMGVKIPDDISVVGFDDMLLASFSSPALTSVRQPLSKFAETAVDTVCARLADPARAATTISLDPVIISRASTAKLK